MSRRATSTRRRAARSSSCCTSRSRTSARRWSWSPTKRGQPRPPTGSSSSRTARSSRTSAAPASRRFSTAIREVTLSVIRVALRGLAGRKLRAALTAMAIVLGVAMISGTFVLTDTIDKAFDTIFVESYANTDASITGKAPDISLRGRQPPRRRRCPQSIARRECARSTASRPPRAAYRRDRHEDPEAGRQGDQHRRRAVVRLRHRSRRRRQFNPLKLVEGSLADRRRRGRHRRRRLRTKRASGSATRSRIATLKPVRQFDVVGIAQYGERQLARHRHLRRVHDPDRARAARPRGPVRRDLRSPPRTASAPEELVERDPADLAAERAVSEPASSRLTRTPPRSPTSSRFIRYFLLAFAGIALFVGAFVIFNTISITVAQRTRELATLRTIGASRRQIRRAVLLEAFVIGAVASVVGFTLGIGLAYGLDWLFGVLNLDLPTTDMVIATRTVIVAFLIGIVVTVLAGPSCRRSAPRASRRSSRCGRAPTLPRGRFSRFSPVHRRSADRRRAPPPRPLDVHRRARDRATGCSSMAGGVLLLFVGVAMISPKLVRPLAAVVGCPRREARRRSPAAWRGGIRCGTRGEPPRPPPPS